MMIALEFLFPLVTLISRHISLADADYPLTAVAPSRSFVWSVFLTFVVGLVNQIRAVSPGSFKRSPIRA